MKINKKKSKIMIMGGMKDKDKQKLTKHIKQYSTTNAYKSLGIMI